MIRLPDDRTLDRFFAKVDDTGDCWVWTAGRFDCGYGAFYHQGRNHPAHRIAYLWFRGPIPAALQIDHLCRNRACVNPAHLDLVDAGTNVRRGGNPAALNARKTACGTCGRPYDKRRSDGSRSCRFCAARRQRRQRLRAAQPAS